MISGLSLYSVASNGQTDPVFLSERGPGANKAGMGSVASLNRGNAVETQANTGNASSNQGFSMGAATFSNNFRMKYLEGFLPSGEHDFYPLYKDMYDNDGIAGGIIDILSTIPFSSFELTGIENKEVLETYQRSCEALRPRILLPALSRDYLTYGVFIGTALYDRKERIFTSVMPQDRMMCKISPVPIYGVDPIIDLKIPQSLMKLMNDKDPRIQRILQQLPQVIRDNMQKGEIRLPSESTLYIPRRSLSADYVGMSYLRRVLPIFLMEKTMFRGSLDQISRRQKPILHLLVGSDEWIATNEDLNNMAGLFRAADTDPVGAIVATRPEVSVSTADDPSAGLHYTEVFDFFTNSKCRALGITEDIISGSASFSSVEANITIFMENMRQYRGMITQEVFYEKLFPAMAYTNGFEKEKLNVHGSKSDRIRAMEKMRDRVLSAEGLRRIVGSDLGYAVNIKDANIKISDYAIPHIEWHKHLKPEGDAQVLETLTQLGEKGVPVPLSMYAAAGGVDLASVLNSLPNDLRLRKELASYFKQVNNLNARMMSDEEREQQTNAAMNKLLSIAAKEGSGNKSFLSREYDERLQPYEKDSQGRRRHTTGRRRRELREKTNRKIAKVISSRNNEEAKHLRRRARQNAKAMVSMRYGKIS